MKRSNKNKDVTTALPKWATFHPYSKSQNETKASSSSKTSNSSADIIQNEHNLIIQNDELLLRTKAYHFTCTEIIKSAFDQILCQQVHTNILTPLRNFMSQFQPITDYCRNNYSCSYDDDNEEHYDEHDLSPKKRRRLDEQNENNKNTRDEFYNQILYQTIQKKNFNPSLLPIAIVHVQPSVLDRHAIMDSLRSQFISSPSDVYSSASMYNPTVCLLSEMNMSADDVINVHGNIKKKSIESLLFSILTQCVKQESHPNQYRNLLQPLSSNLFTPNVIADKIIAWAQRTTEFNAILILIENPEMITSETLNMFISILSTMRCVHGIPVGLVFFSISKELIQKELLSNNINLSQLNGEVGVVFHEFDSVSSKVMVHGLIDRLFNNRQNHSNLPIILSQHVVDTILHQFNNNHGSLVLFIKQLEMALAHHFTMPGTFLALIDNDLFMEKYKNHITWFLVDPNSRQRIMSSLRREDDTNEEQVANMGTSNDLIRMMQVVFEERTFHSLICTLLNVTQVHLKDYMSQCSNKQCSTKGLISSKYEQIMITVAYLTKSQQYSSLVEKLFAFVRKSFTRDLLMLFGKFIQVVKNYLPSLRACRVSQDPRCHGDIASEKLMSICSFFDSSIVLLDQVPDDMILWDLREWIIEELSGLLSYRTTAPLSCTIFYGKHDRVIAYTSSLSTQPRHDLASAIGDPDYEDNYTLIADMRVAYTVFDSRVILVAEWFRRFTECRILHRNQVNSKTETLQCFAFCVYQLMVCGLVVRSRRVENGFEKAALVWATK